MITCESPLQMPGDAQVEVVECPSRPAETAYFEFIFRFPDVISANQPELQDHEVLHLAETADSFAFLNSEEEDIYNDLIKKP